MRSFEAVVLGRPRAAADVAAGIAGALAAASAGGAAIVATTSELPYLAAGPAGRGALRLRDRLERDLPAPRAAGRLVWCTVGDRADALLAAAAGAPVVLAVCGPRRDWTDELLAGAAPVHLAAETDGPSEELALLDLRGRGLDVTVTRPPSGVRAHVARLGLARGAAGWRATA